MPGKDLAQAQHLGPHRSPRGVLGVGHQGELVRADPSGVERQEGQELCVPQAEPDGLSAHMHHPVVGAEDLQAVAVQCPGSLGGRSAPCAGQPALEAVDAELRLGGGYGGLDKGQRVGGDGIGGARDVDDPEYRSRIRIMEGHGRAAPGVHLRTEMLRARNLDTGSEGKGCARRTGPDCRFGPVRSRHEQHPFGPPAQLPVAVDPQQAAVLVAHRHQKAAVDAWLDQQPVDDGHDGGQRMVPPVGIELVLGIENSGGDGAGIGKVRQGPQP